MSKFESSIKKVAYPQENVYKMLSDLSNIERVRNRIPEDKLKTAKHLLMPLKDYLLREDF